VPEEGDAYMTRVVETTLALSRAEHEKAALLRQARREARQRRERLRAERDLAVWNLYHLVGLSAPQIAERVRVSLELAGADPKLAPSHDKVRRIVGSRRNPAPKPELGAS
jgi:hypothetical protein